MSEKKKIHPLQRAWAAGVFDARIYFPKSGAVLRFESTDEPLIRRFHETVGLGKVAKDETKRTAVPVYVFQTLNMDDSRELLLLVAPFLSPRRFKDASEMLARIERNPNWQKKNKNTKKVTLSETVPAQSAEDGQEPQSTATDGATVSPAE